MTSGPDDSPKETSAAAAPPSVPPPTEGQSITNHHETHTAHAPSPAHSQSHGQHKVHHHIPHHFPRLLLRRKSTKVQGRVAGSPSTPTSTAPTAAASAPLNEVPAKTQQDGDTVPSDSVAEAPSGNSDASNSQSTTVKFMEQVLDWVRHERQRQRDWVAKREAKKVAKAAASASQSAPPPQPSELVESGAIAPDSLGAVTHENKDVSRASTPNSTSTTETAHIGASTDSLDHLERLVQATIQAASTPSLPPTPPSGFSPKPSKKKSLRKLTPSHPPTSYGSDTDANPDGEVLVPECDVFLETPEKIGWDGLKREVLKLTHTLRCKGWRRIALDRYKEVEITRISGALTNAVFLVKPPPVVDSNAALGGTHQNAYGPQSRRIPSKLLLRIYGAQVSHLIDRPSELSILRRLAVHKIGPRLLGTFKNGRFEQYFESTTLTKDDIRDPSTSRMIAKRMKELHQGVEVLDEERKQGPVVWKNWEKWLGRVREVMKILDSEEGKSEVERKWGGKHGQRVCGSEWVIFEQAVRRYRRWLIDRYEGGEEEVKRELVFAHNDTQYGNILRIHPTTTDSPLLLPSNTHKQLIVIDFEYASPNLPGFEIANHFCEWMANYHDPYLPHVLLESCFPTASQQINFLRAYVTHQNPLLAPVSSSSTNSSTTHLAQFNLDARTPVSYKEEEGVRQKVMDDEIEKLREEARAWRPASHAMWAAWGIVQAKVDEQEQGRSLEPIAENRVNGEPEQDGQVNRDKGEQGGQEEPISEPFDYLGYAQQRALLFWGDMVSLGVMTREEVERLLEGNRKAGGMGVKMVE